MTSVFFHVFYFTLTLDDDIFGTRSDDYQVKALSNRTTDKEGHATDTIASLTCVVFVLHFRRCGEGQLVGVKTLLNDLFDGNGTNAVISLIVTADGWYGKEPFLDKISHSGLSSALVMPNLLLRVHLLVAMSTLKPTLDKD